eukprot:CAMPEP_0170102776 /NCGR_PEP_ID=MMETSP0020_2-20130122/3084_1 /TAXON_ID=98059 /ORGANISM="Dinobryon sp., Strain UTEXLB2267" /LENGTH=159 /DNA_ID=CAMNT_0010326185 /DNA_START=111 /DNA_END=590 /DNA_ORIENTATION=+
MEDDSSSIVSTLTCSVSVAVETKSMTKEGKPAKFSLVNAAKSIISMRKSLPAVTRRKKMKKHSLADDMEVKMPIGERRRLKILDTIPSMGSLLRIIRDEKSLLVVVQLEAEMAASLIMESICTSTAASKLAVDFQFVFKWLESLAFIGLLFQRTIRASH